MAEINLDQLGPVDYVVVGFPADKADFSGAMADELKKLMDSGTVRVLDLLMVTKDEDGTVAVAELRDHDDSDVGELRSLEADLSLVLALEDVERVGADLEPGSAAAVLVWENTWAGSVRIGDSPFRRGADRDGSHPHSGAHRRGRGGPRGGRGRSVTRVFDETRWSSRPVIRGRGREHRVDGRAADVTWRPGKPDRNASCPPE